MDSYPAAKRDGRGVGNTFLRPTAEPSGPRGHTLPSSQTGSSPPTPQADSDVVSNEPQLSAGADSSRVVVPGPEDHEDMSLLSRALDAGCSLLQSRGPIGRIHQHVCAYHMYAHDATRPVRAHHYCAHRSGEMRQCVLYDSDRPDARLIGIEYIISRRLFESLPAEERKYWHSHVYEVQSGMLVTPGVPAAAEDADMRQVINTYGKVWHTWQVDRGDPLPLGPPQLMMAYVADGQLPPEQLEARDRDIGVDSQAVRHRRSHLAADPPEPHPDADHPWRTGQAWQVTMQLRDFKRPQPGEVPLALPLPRGGEPAALNATQGGVVDGGGGSSSSGRSSAAVAGND